MWDTGGVLGHASVGNENMAAREGAPIYMQRPSTSS